MAAEAKKSVCKSYRHKAFTIHPSFLNTSAFTFITHCHCNLMTTAGTHQLHYTSLVQRW